MLAWSPLEGCRDRATCEDACTPYRFQWMLSMLAWVEPLGVLTAQLPTGYQQSSWSKLPRLFGLQHHANIFRDRITHSSRRQINGHAASSRRKDAVQSPHTCLTCTLDTPAFVDTPELRHRFQLGGLPRPKLGGEVLASPRQQMPALAPPNEPQPVQAWGVGTTGAGSDSPT